jgi:hypothetical protein
MICPCELLIESTNATPYQTATYNIKGEVIFAICQHGHIVINKLNEEKEVNKNGKDNNTRPKKR